MSERSQVLALLDELHAAESAGAAAMARWLEVARDPTLRGGLRTIAARDRAHGTLALERLRALGGTAERVPSEARSALLRLVEAPDVPDEAKLRAVVARLPSDRTDRVQEAAGRIVQDLETRALVETMGDEDRASLAWLHAMSEGTGEAAASRDVDPDATVGGLAAFATAEATSAMVFHAWGAACESPGLRGGLRTIAVREATHTSLLQARLAELQPAAATPEPLAGAAAVAARWAAPEWSDVQKLDALLAHRPSPAAVAATVLRLAAVADAETRAMLLLIADGEQATMAWLGAYRRAVPSPAPRGVEPAVIPLRGT